MCMTIAKMLPAMMLVVMMVMMIVKKVRSEKASSSGRSYANYPPKNQCKNSKTTQ